MSYFPTRILLATDGSEDAAVTTRAAVDLADRSGSELHVMHAFEFVPPRKYMSVALRLSSPSDFSRQGQRLLDEQVERIEEVGSVVAGAHLRTGSPVDQILYASEELEAGLVVVGRRGLGGVKQVVRAADGPVLVYPRPREG
jgi:nucleotide-binding universal stress UspA family protein